MKVSNPGCTLCYACAVSNLKQTLAQFLLIMSISHFTVVSNVLLFTVETREMH